MALVAFDTEDDEGSAVKRAQRETGLDPDQLSRLRARGDKARAKGYTLISTNHKFSPTNYDADEEGLLGKEEQKGDERTRGVRDKLRSKREEQEKDKRRAAGGRVPKATMDAVSRATHPPGFRETPDRQQTRRAQEAWTRLHECDGNKMCAPCRAAQHAARQSRLAGGDIAVGKLGETFPRGPFGNRRGRARRR
jgi:hypothetical protein